MAKTNRYKVSGTVTFFVDDIVEKNEKEAKKAFDLEEDVHYAAQKGNIELVGELNTENLGHCNKDKFYETREC